MRKVAVFGNAGVGKSTLAKALARQTGLPLYPLDLMQFGPGGIRIPYEQYRASHDQTLAQDHWIIDGYGCADTLWARLAAADTLIYVDLPLAVHYWWVTKRLLMSPLVAPEGWPTGSPMWSSTVSSYKVVGLCHRNLTPRYRAFVAASAATKQVFHLRSGAEIKRFLQTFPVTRRSSRCVD